MGTTAYKKYLQRKNTFENILTGINKEELVNLASQDNALKKRQRQGVRIFRVEL
jgi:hypothetical protein